MFRGGGLRFAVAALVVGSTGCRATTDVPHGDAAAIENDAEASDATAEDVSSGDALSVDGADDDAYSNCHRDAAGMTAMPGECCVSDDDCQLADAGFRVSCCLHHGCFYCGPR